MFDNQTILLTGATGFIGKNLSFSLKNKGANVIELSSSTDLRKKDSLNNWNGKVDYVIHAAGKVFVPDSWIHPLEFLEVNAGGTETVMEFCRQNKLGCTFISGYVYGKNTPLPIRENSLIEPSNPYAYSKFIGESICRMYHNCFQVPVQIIRPFNVYGKGQSENFLIPSLINQFKKSDRIKVKDLNPRRDYIHIDDLSELVLKTCFRKDFNVLNAGTGISTSVGELIDKLALISGRKMKVENENVRRENEIDDSVADISSAKGILNWRPEIDIHKGLEKIFNDWI